MLWCLRTRSLTHTTPCHASILIPSCIWRLGDQLNKLVLAPCTSFFAYQSAGRAVLCTIVVMHVIRTSKQAALIKLSNSNNSKKVRLACLFLGCFCA